MSNFLSPATQVRLSGMIDTALALTNGQMEILIECEDDAEMAFGQAQLRGRHRCKAITLRVKSNSPSAT